MDYKLDRVELHTIRLFDNTLQQAKYTEAKNEANRPSTPPPVNTQKR